MRNDEDAQIFVLCLRASQQGTVLILSLSKSIDSGDLHHKPSVRGATISKAKDPIYRHDFDFFHKVSLFLGQLYFQKLTKICIQLFSQNLVVVFLLCQHCLKISSFLMKFSIYSQDFVIFHYIST